MGKDKKNTGDLSPSQNPSGVDIVSFIRSIDKSIVDKLYQAKDPDKIRTTSTLSAIISSTDDLANAKTILNKPRELERFINWLQIDWVQNQEPSFNPLDVCNFIISCQKLDEFISELEHRDSSGSVRILFSSTIEHIVMLLSFLQLEDVHLNTNLNDRVLNMLHNVLTSEIDADQDAEQMDLFGIAFRGLLSDLKGTDSLNKRVKEVIYNKILNSQYFSDDQKTKIRQALDQIISDFKPIEQVMSAEPETSTNDNKVATSTTTSNDQPEASSTSDERPSTTGEDDSEAEDEEVGASSSGDKPDDHPDSAGGTISYGFVNDEPEIFNIVSFDNSTDLSQIDDQGAKASRQAVENELNSEASVIAMPKHLNTEDVYQGDYNLGILNLPVLFGSAAAMASVFFHQEDHSNLDSQGGLFTVGAVALIALHELL